METLSSSMCRSCRSRLTNTSIPIRTFSTSRRRQIVPPESPTYIDVPSSFQPELPLPKREKGILPVPRELFPSRRPDKPSQQYLDNLTPSPLPKNEVPYENLSESGKYRYRMAQLRKQHIREGLKELHQRKLNTVKMSRFRSDVRKAESARLATQPPREDARLTNNSVPQAMKIKRSSTPIADELAAAKAQHERKVANYSASSSAKTEERLDALHTLYMNARTFITNEEQLHKAIAEQFDDPSIFRNDVGDGKSIWNRGPPDTIRNMIMNNQAQDGGAGSTLNMMRRGAAGNRVRFQRDQERLKKIAETLSGGKI